MQVLYKWAKINRSFSGIYMLLENQKVKCQKASTDAVSEDRGQNQTPPKTA